MQPIRLPILHRPLHLLAWLFIAGSAVQITTGVTNDAGAAGAQLLVLLAAVVSTLLPITLLRRAAHLILIGWAGLWTGDAVLAFTHTPEFSSLMSMSWLSTLLFATLYRAVAGWWPAHARATAPSVPTIVEIPNIMRNPDPTPDADDVDLDNEDELTADRIHASGRLREIPTDQLRRLRDWANTHLPVQKSKAASMHRLEQLRQAQLGHRARRLVDCARSWSNRSRSRIAGIIDPQRATPTA
ncbi:MAG: hypothetical protein KC983_08010 [Phycisphaerales bacterium]|nr:hypothetical protein [Phycisphaerales bacterium]